MYMNKLFFVVCFLSLVFLFDITAAQENTVELYFFYGQGCPVCAQTQSFLGNLVQKYPNLSVKSYEVFSNTENRALYSALAKSYHINSDSVPGIFIGEQAFITYNDAVARQIENAVIKCTSQQCISPLEKFNSGTAKPFVAKTINKIKIITLIIIISLIAASIFLFRRRFVLQEK